MLKKKKVLRENFHEQSTKQETLKKANLKGPPQDGVFCFRFLSANEKRSKKRLQNFKREAPKKKKKLSNAKLEKGNLQAKSKTVSNAGICLHGFACRVLSVFACRVLPAGFCWRFFFFCFRFFSVHAKLSKEKLQKKNSLKRNSEGKTSNAKIARGKLWTRETSQLEAKPCQNLESEKEKTF